MSAPGCALGVMFRRENPPEALPTYARQVEAMGLDELWVVEDCFYAGGLTSAAVALAVTDRVRVGLGIMPGVARSPAFSAMEIAALARMYPGRFLPGMGHGMADWMKQIGVFPKSQLAALSETAEVVRRLLAGETVTFHGQHVHHDRVKLEFPPTEAPPLTLGVRGPRSLAMSGRSADGTILAELSSPAYVRWARERIQAGQAEAGRAGAPHRLTVYMLYAVDDDAAAARRRLRPLIASWLSYGQVDYLRPLGIEEEANDLLARGGREALEAGMPDAWIDQMAVVGTPDDCAAAVQRLVDAGADSVGFVTEQPGMEGLAAVARLLPALRPG
ncbi:MAG: LLM class flavin-dependent oxidoreductase [Anaerolineae bacterium]|nr:LLM class flavin-dependent oxidoreductase [Anaerolineae bacterium]